MPQYKGYEIEAEPYQLADSKEWQINVLIWKHHGSHSVQRSFSAANSFKTKEEAIKASLKFGAQIIDGKVKNCFVEDL